jgi:hypothetical protein
MPYGGPGKFVGPTGKIRKGGSGPLTKARALWRVLVVVKLSNYDWGNHESDRFLATNAPPVNLIQRDVVEEGVCVEEYKDRFHNSMVRMP